jgi:MbtH protein
VHGPGSRQDVLDHIETGWADMRPRSLVEQMERGVR